jgi:inward rectifier potassium channel
MRTYSAVKSGNIRMVGRHHSGLSELYYFLVTGSWLRLLGLIAVANVCLNVLFALGYLRMGGVENMQVGSFRQAFFFSVQTFATVGYGAMYPSGTGANLLMAVESVVSLLMQAVATGLVFAKFSHPHARVLFSNVAVVAMRDGKPTLMFRIANERGNHVVEAQLRVAVLRNERTSEDEPYRRVIDLSLLRSESPAFVLSWTVIHIITPDSPLHGMTPALLAEQNFELVVNVSGVDESIGQHIRARYAWGPEDLRFNQRFADILLEDSEGRRVIDFRRFHDTVLAKSNLPPPWPEDIVDAA